jgi:hypothetical protein
MKTYQIEYWALKIIERVDSDQPVEDFRVELKADWPPPEKAARRLAGHANAARGTPILWLIGVDERRGLIGARHQELSTWFLQVESYFDGLPPQMLDLNIPIANNTVVALYFETKRAPYVVKNPAFGSPNSGPIEREVPWREGTRVRSATHTDLIKILSPLQELPDFEIMSGELIGYRMETNHTITIYLSLDITFYVTPPNYQQIAIPFHRCEAKCIISDSIGWFYFTDFLLRPPTLWIPNGSIDLSKTIQSTQDEVLIFGPGKILLEGKSEINLFQEIPDAVKVSIKMQPSNTENSVHIEPIFHLDESGTDDYKWSFRTRHND